MSLHCGVIMPLEKPHGLEVYLRKKTSKKVGDVPLPCLFLCGLLFGGWEHEFYDFPYMVIITPTDFIFFRGVETTNQIVVVCYEKLIKHMWINCVVFWVQDRGGSEMGVENKRLKKAKGTYFSEGFQSVLEIISGKGLLHKMFATMAAQSRGKIFVVLKSKAGAESRAAHQTLCKRCGSTPRIPPYSHWILSWFFGQQETTNYYEQMTMYIYNIYIYTLYIYMWSRLPPARFPPPNGMGLQVAPPFPSICKLLAAFLRSSLVFARFLQRFWVPRYPLDDLRGRHTPSKYLRATYNYSHIYMCYVSTSYKYIYIYIHVIDTYI